MKPCIAPGCVVLVSVEPHPFCPNHARKLPRNVRRLLDVTRAETGPRSAQHLAARAYAQAVVAAMPPNPVWTPEKAAEHAASQIGLLVERGFLDEDGFARLAELDPNFGLLLAHVRGGGVAAR